LLGRERRKLSLGFGNGNTFYVTGPVPRAITFFSHRMRIRACAVPAARLASLDGSPRSRLAPQLFGTISHGRAGNGSLDTGKSNLRSASRLVNRAQRIGCSP
jgi:hypothetical protein